MTLSTAVFHETLLASYGETRSRHATRKACRVSNASRVAAKECLGSMHAGSFFLPFLPFYIVMHFIAGFNHRNLQSKSTRSRTFLASAYPLSACFIGCVALL